MTNSQSKIAKNIPNVSVIANKLSQKSLEGNAISRIKQLEERLLFEILDLNPKSKIHRNKSHRSKEESDKTFYLNSSSLSNSIIVKDGIKPKIIDENNGGSYVDISNLEHITMYYYKKSGGNPIIFDFSPLKKTIKDIYDNKKSYKFPLVLFSNSKLEAYPIYYEDSNKKHCGFANDSYKIVSKHIQDLPSTLNELFKLLPNTDNIIEEKTIQKKQNQTGGNKIIEDSENNKYFKMWEEIFNITGELPKDCPCKQYSKALYNRCVIQGKPKRGIRTVHKNNCNKIIEKIVLKKD
jgi:hypothetical protein